MKRILIILSLIFLVVFGSLIISQELLAKPIEDTKIVYVEKVEVETKEIKDAYKRLVEKAKNVKHDFTNLKNKTTSFLISDSRGTVFAKNNENKILPIASITKLMNYIVAIDEIEKKKLDINKEYKVKREAVDHEETSYKLNYNEKVTIKELINVMLIVSANDSAKMLSIIISGTEENHVKKMNLKAKQIGMKNTTFYTSSGLDNKNNKSSISTSIDLEILMRYIQKNHFDIYDITKNKEFENKNRNYKRKSTISLIRQLVPSVEGLKTGYLENAGYCFVGSFKIESERYYVIELGAKTREDRANIVKEAFDYVTKFYK